MNKWISNRYIKILVILLCIALIFSFRYIVNASDYSQSEDVQVNIIDREAGINSTVSAVGDDSQSDTVAAEISQSVEDLEQETSLSGQSSGDNSSINIINAVVPAYSISKVTDNNVVIDYSNMPQKSAEELIRAFDDTSGQCVEVLPKPGQTNGSEIYDSLTEALSDIDEYNLELDYTIVFLRNYDMTANDTDAQSLMAVRNCNIVLEGENTDIKVRFPPYIYLKNASTSIQKMTIVDLEHVYAEGRTINIGNEADDKRIIMASGTKPSIYGLGTQDADETEINLIGGSYGDVIGGAEKTYPYTANTTSVNITNAVVSGNVYGGSHDARVLGETNLRITNSTVAGFIIGGGYNKSATVETTNVIIMNSDIVGNVLAGGYYGDVNGTTNLTLEGGSVGSWVLGGSYGDEEGKVITFTGSTNLSVSGTTVVKNIVGGGYYADVNGDTNMDIKNTNVEGRVIGGCNTGKVTGVTNLSMTDGNVLESIVGGGFTQTDKLETVTGNTNINLSNVDVIQSVYGGGYNAPVNGSTYVSIFGGSVGQNIYGGGYNGSVNYSVDGTGNTNISVGNVVVGNESSQNTGNIYGGGSASQAVVEGNVIINIRSGTQLRHILGDSSTGNVFGAGEVAETVLDGNSAITISGGTVGGCVYGAGDSGTMNGNPSVIIDGGTIIGDVYGGAYKGKLTGNPSVTVTGGSINSLYGGSNKENISGDLFVTIDAGVINGNVFGGCLSGNITEGSVSTTINGGTINGVIYGGSDSGSITNTDDDAPAVSLIINDGIFNAVGNVIYGGSNTGLINGSVKLEVGTEIKRIQTLSDKGIVSGSSNGTLNGNVNVIINNVILGYIQNVNESNSVIKRNANVMIGNNVHLTGTENSIDGIGGKGKIAGESSLYLGNFDMSDSKTVIEGSIVNVMNISTYGDNTVKGSIRSGGVIKTSGTLFVNGSIETFNQLFIGAVESSTVTICQNLDCKSDNDGDLIFSKGSSLILQGAETHTVNNLVVMDDGNVLRLTKETENQITALKVQGVFRDGLDENSSSGRNAQNKLIVSIQKATDDGSCELSEGDNIIIFNNADNAIAANFSSDVKGFSLHKGTSQANEKNVIELIGIGKPKINLVKVDYIDTSGTVTEFDTPSTPKNMRTKPDKRLTFDITDDESGTGFNEEVAAYIDVESTPDTAWASNTASEISAQNSEVIKISIEKGEIDEEGIQHWTGSAILPQCDSTQLYYVHIKDNTVQADNSANYSTVPLDTHSPIKLSDSSLSKINDKRIFKVTLKDNVMDSFDYKAAGLKYVGWSVDGDKKDLLWLSEWENGIENLYDIQKVQNTESNAEYIYSMTIDDSAANKVIYIYMQDYVGNVSILPFNLSDTIMSVTVNPSANTVSLNNGLLGDVLATDMYITNKSQKALQADIVSVTADSRTETVNRHTVVPQKTMYNPGDMYLSLNYRKTDGQFAMAPLANISSVSLENILNLGTISSGFDAENKMGFVINGLYQPTSADMTAILDRFSIRYRLRLVDTQNENQAAPTEEDTTPVPVTEAVTQNEQSTALQTPESQTPVSAQSTSVQSQPVPPATSQSSTERQVLTESPTAVSTRPQEESQTTVVPQTQPATVMTESPTTVSTQAPTEVPATSQTQPPTEVQTESTTQASTEASTEPATTPPVTVIPPTEDDELIVTTKAVR